MNKHTNLNNKNREEKFIIYTTIFQLNKLAASDLIFIDATFRTSPKHYYQMLNILCKDRESNSNIPVVHIPMSHKTSFLYDKVFDSINKISNDLSIEINLDKKTCITDFELSLRKVLREKYGGIKLRGCFFHYVKALWSKAKKLGLCTKKNLPRTKLIIFTLKILTLQSWDYQKKNLDEIKKYINGFEDNKAFQKFITYYEKNWFNNEFIRFEICYDKNIKIRTDNVCEGFHRKLNQRIQYQHPKNSVVCETLKEIAIESFKICVDSLITVNKESVMDDNIFMQCYDYLNQYHIKYQKELEFKDIDELAKDPENNIDKITKSILSLYRDSYIRNLEIKSEVEENGIIKGESNNLIDDKDMTSEEEEVLEITEKTEKINLSDEKEIEPYDPGCEEDLAQNLSKKSGLIMQLKMKL